MFMRRGKKKGNYPGISRRFAARPISLSTGWPTWRNGSPRKRTPIPLILKSAKTRRWKNGIHFKFASRPFEKRPCIKRFSLKKAELVFDRFMRPSKKFKSFKRTPHPAGHFCNVCLRLTRIKPRRVLGLLALKALVFHSPCNAEATLDIPELFRQTGRDGIYLLASPARLGVRDILPSILIGGAVASTFAYDDNIRDHMTGLRNWG